MSEILLGTLAASLVEYVEVAKLCCKDGSLHLVHARVGAYVWKYIFTAAAIVAQGSHNLSQLMVVGSHSSCIAQGARFLPG